MIDPLLEERLDALDRQLHSAVESDWLRPVLQAVEVREAVWAGLKSSIGQQAHFFKEHSIRKIREMLEESEALDPPDAARKLEEAWAAYAKVYQESQELFGEFLEFIGGLAFRGSLRFPEEGVERETPEGRQVRRLVDSGIYRLADELVRQCSEDTIGYPPWASITIPARQEAVKITLAQIIRLRFPGWAIWTLPLAIHEFGHVVFAAQVQGLDEDAQLARFVEQQASGWIRGGLRYGRRRNVEVEMASLHVSEFCADAFATYYAGPAYACAAIHLKLNPVADAGGNDGPSDLARGHVILEMMDRMNRATPERADGPYGALYNEAAEAVRRSWDAATRASGAAPLDQNEIGRLNALVEELLEQLRVSVQTTTKYPEDEPGWETARKWYEGWANELSTEDGLIVPSNVSFQTLRDAVNAAWLFRVFHPSPAHYRKAQTPALRLCEAIIGAHRDSGRTQSVHVPGDVGGKGD